MIEGGTYWLVGASEGLGRALAQRLDAEGCKLILSARSEPRLSELAQTLISDARVVPVDLSDAISIQAAVDQVGDAFDGLIYCAGQYDPSAAPDWSPEPVERMADVNFNGALRILGRTVPQMVQRGPGHIVIIGSLAGFTGLPNAIGYGASKAAVMHLAENLQADLRNTQIKVQLANPGFIRTRLTDKNSFKMPFLMEPEQAADHVFRAMRSRRFSTSFPMLFSWFFRLARFLPRRLLVRLF
ncbi:MAG: SDR family NAD(P)-dependent oxidoreductase [Rhodobacteraceae bacterium]|nr:SDR family NAD(P)-dependent oxidoreductase [Paracoccaceae bacterium]